MGNIFSALQKKTESVLGKDLAYGYNPLAAEVEQINQGAERDAKAEVDKQAAAVRKSSEQAAKQAQEAAAQAAKQQESAAARRAAESAASDLMDKPQEAPDVQIGGVDTGTSRSAAARKKRQSFGTAGAYSSGVNI